MTGYATIIPPVSPEFSLVCACIARPLTPARIARIAARAAPAINWPLVDKIVAQQRVAGLMAEGLKAAGIPVNDTLRHAATRTATAALAQAGEGLRLNHLLDQAGVPVLFLKGSTLAMLAYGSIAVRNSIDIDMVVRPEDALRAWQVLDAAGYIRTTPARMLPPSAFRTYQKISKDSVHYHPGRRVRVELHWRMSEAILDSPPPPVAEWQSVRIGGAGSLRTLEDAALFTYLCTHGALHAWARLKWLTDVAALIEQSADGGDRFWAHGQTERATTAIASAIMLSNALFGTPLPPGFAVPRSWRLRWFNTVSVKVITAGGGTLNLGQTGWRIMLQPLVTILTLTSVRDAWGLARCMLIPAEDVALLRLPAALEFLYPVLRLPLWVWKRTPWSSRGKAGAQARLGKPA